MKIDKRSNGAMYVTTKTHTIYIDDSVDGETYVSVWITDDKASDRALYHSINNELIVNKAKLLK